MNRFHVDPDISKAKTIDKSVYLSHDIFDAMKESIFAPSWQFIGDTSRAPEVGSLYPFTFVESYVDDPLLLSRDKDSQLHCLSNVCTHRGNLLTTISCKSPHGIVCKYHGRKFQGNGKFSFMPEFKEVKDFPSEVDNLKSYPLHQWGHLIFTSLSETHDPSEYFHAMQDRLAWLPIEQFVFRPELSKDYSIDANWALYCENYLEGFHIPFVHEGLNAVIDYGSYETECKGNSVLQIAYSKSHEDSFTLPDNSSDHGKSIAAFYYWIFPNMMFNFYPWGLSINIVQPVSPEKTNVKFLTYMWDESKYNFGAGSSLDKVELEDEEIVQNVQKGIKSRAYRRGRYSVTREQGTHHFHRLLAEALQHL